MKRCLRCDRLKPHGQFSRWKHGDGYQTWCNHCFRIWRYRLTPQQFSAMYETQAGRCAICIEPIEIETCCIDHDHKCCPGNRSCGRCVRGLLCKSCNHGLGDFREDELIMNRAIAYVAKTDRL
ncbi:hypothetical protein Wildcat_93 [Mycobacterium phage Wildcat]|uniref:Endonuclease VII n=2 Tax=Mycobacterium virus Wildcat TaxID=1993859 RepID=Q19XW7_9CAUD|nr:endonuclease VII [Mycobacterium phage Wildcat]ABE67698.1 hypothetical protein Wildcat_93 [Mycobacterium phage Wildcat]QGJ89980.1 hypothetical protein PBI_MARYV_93 [Mycobacterium phage MaryV]